MINEKMYTEINVVTGEKIERLLTTSELIDLNTISELGAAQMAEYQAKITQKAALLERLGITADEAKLLLA